MQWMHSERKVELFDEVFVQVDPQFLSSLSPLLVLSVAATVSENLKVHIRERLDWIEMCLVAMNIGVCSIPRSIWASMLIAKAERTGAARRAAECARCHPPAHSAELHASQSD